MEDLRLNAESLRSVCTKWQNTFGIDQKIEDDMKIGRLCRIAIGIEGNAHRISEDVRIETGRKCCNRYLGKIMQDSFFSEDKFKLFYGEKFSDPEKRSISSAYTTSRSAVISASVFALLNKGYKYDDIFDDSKLVKEKQEMYEAVIERMRSDVPAEEHKKNQEWLAENYYEGHKKAVGLLSSAARDIDFNNPEILSDPKFMRFFNLAYCDFDCYQEMKRCCGNEILAVAQKEKPDITLERLNDLWDDEVINSRLIVAQITHFKEDIEKFAGNSRHNDHMIGALVFHRYALKRIGSYIEEEKKKPNGDLLAGGNADEKYCFDHTLASAYPEFQKRFRYLAKDPVTANDLIGAVMKDEFFSDLHVEFDRQKNVVRKITGTYPNDIKAKALAEKYRFMSETAMDDRLSAVAAMADDAQKNVFRGSREYDEAISSIKALDAAYKTLGTDKTTDISRTEELEKAQQAMEKARRDIERYIKRKEDQGLGNYNADAKTQKRINAMRLALELVNDVRYDIEDRVIEVGTKEAERSNRRIKNEDITSANNYRQELEIETAGISDRNLRRAAEGALDAVGKLNKLTPPDRTRPLSEQEVEKARLYMSKVTFYEMIRDKINPMVPNGKENYDTAIKDFSKLSLMKTLTRDLNHEQIKDFLASPRPFVKDVIETYGKLKMGSEKSADAPKRLSNKQKTVSKDPMKHGK